ncbi:MAG TPA: heparinase II/III family protein [Planctomycetota bacterium]|nr:heparinase II/III family protein [Planctomycetota bacterium]
MLRPGAMLLAFALLWPAAGGETVLIGGVAVPADCALAKKEHPRLLFTRADLPRLRERLKQPRLAKELEWAKSLAADGKASAILLGVLYHLTGEKAYLDQARAKLRPSWVQTYPLAADLVMGGLGPEEQRAEADRLVAVLKAERWRPHVALALAAWGHGHDEFLDDDLKKRYPEDLVRGVAYNNLWSQGRGGSSMSHGYNGEHFYTEWLTMAVAWSNATGQDWVSKCDFAAHAPEWYLFHYRPWAARVECVHVGVTAMCAHWMTVTPATFDGDDLAVLVATRFRDGVGQWWIDNVISKISMGWGTSALGQGGVWGKLLWYDPDLPPVEPAMLPPARLFPENGHAVMRSDWGPAATYALFRCGRFGEIDGAWGRNNADNLHFLIGKRGILAADTGAVHTLNNAALGFAGAKAPGDTPPHRTEYARQTIAHNSITVGREPIVHVDWRGQPTRDVVRRGGQSPIQDKAWWKLWGLPERKPGDRPFREGRIVAYETSPLFDYAAGDATHSYPPTRVKSITRQFVYLRPDAFVVFDRVEAAEPGLETIWNLHSLYEPAWNGTKGADPSLPPEKQFILSDDGKMQIANPRPGGRFVHTGGDTFTMDDQWPGMQGRLFVRLLLPAEDARIVRTIGGAWHEFEVDGINHGPTEATYAKHKGGRDQHNRENTIGVEGWRIEVEAKGRPAAAHFLTVLFAADQATPQMPPIERVEQGGQVGARLTLGGRECEVTFATSGPVAARLRITEAGRTLVDRPLADNVEDHYRKWSEDPRYKAWTTRPELRNFIGTEEPAR